MKSKANCFSKNLFLYITVIIAVILLAGVVVLMTACDDKPQESTGLRIAADGKSDYKIIYPFTDDVDSDEEFFSAARALANSITANTDAIVSLVGEDEVGTTDNTAKEILVGITSKHIYTQEEIDKLGDLGYMIKTDGNRILILGSDSDTCRAAVNHLLTFYLDKEAKEMTVPDGLFTIDYIEPKAAPAPDPEITYGPTVFVVNDEYQIVYHSNLDGLAWVEVDGIKYYDEYAGIIKSETSHHNVAVPMEALDKAGSYTVCFAPVEKRDPYHPKSGATVNQTYNFRPVDFSDGVQIYSVADPHSNTELCSKAAQYYGDKLDLLVLCGDILSESTSLEKMYDISIIASNITKGELPVVYARGNHEIRGEASEFINDYIGTDNGNPYFTFRIGSLWGVVLDCGEDKADSHVEYGGMIAFDKYRNEQTKFLQNVVNNADSEYNAEGVEYRIAICHVPFSAKESYPPSPEIFTKWNELCAQMNLDMMLAGHTHSAKVIDAGSRIETQNYYLVITSSSNRTITDGETSYIEYTGTAIDLNETEISVKFTNTKKEVVEGGKSWKR